MFLYNKSSRFNIANLVTFANIAFGLTAMYFIQQDQFTLAIILAWVSGGLDILDGKLARYYKLSSEFGVQLDSFADFVSFVIMPSFLLFYALNKVSGVELIVSGIVFIYYIISGLRRLIEFNIQSEVGEVEQYFIGVPTPLGAILLWILYLVYSYSLITNIFIILLFVVLIAYLFNSKLKIRHP
jgi:CDP-diacylglycerol--serine O-phosphatidyltransferase